MFSPGAGVGSKAFAFALSALGVVMSGTGAGIWMKSSALVMSILGAADPVAGGSKSPDA